MKGVAPEWKALPRRRCDNCPKIYRPGRPVRSGERGFCCDNCRKEFHKHGGSFSKLKPVIEAEVRKRIKELAPVDGALILQLLNRIRRLEQLEERLRAALEERST